MGKDYTPVYAADVAGPTGSVTISPERVQMLGVRTEIAAMRTMTRAVRAVGTVAVDERRLAVIAPRFEGWIEKLLVGASGDPVRAGQTLFEFYSPDLALAESCGASRTGSSAISSRGPTAWPKSPASADSSSNIRSSWIRSACRHTASLCRR